MADKLASKDMIEMLRAWRDRITAESEKSKKADDVIAAAVSATKINRVISLVTDKRETECLGQQFKRLNALANNCRDAKMRQKIVDAMIYIMEETLGC